MGGGLFGVIISDNNFFPKIKTVFIFVCLIYCESDSAEDFELKRL